MVRAKLTTSAWPRRLGVASGFILRAVTVLVIALAIYALSVAPAFKLALEHPRLGGAFEVVYHPVIRLCADRFGPIESFYWWYCTSVWRIPMMR